MRHSFQRFISLSLQFDVDSNQSLALELTYTTVHAPNGSSTTPRLSPESRQIDTKQVVGQVGDHWCGPALTRDDGAGDGCIWIGPSAVSRVAVAQRKHREQTRRAQRATLPSSRPTGTPLDDIQQRLTVACARAPTPRLGLGLDFGASKPRDEASTQRLRQLPPHHGTILQQGDVVWNHG